MIRKYYEVSYDICGKTINHYSNYVPTNKELRKICGKFAINNGKVVTICEACVETFKDKNNKV